MEAGFVDNSPLLPILGAVVIAAVTWFFCRSRSADARVEREPVTEMPDYLYEFDADGVREGRRALE